MVTTMIFKFSGDLPKKWSLTFAEIYPFIADLPVDPLYTRDEMLSVYFNGVPTEDLSCNNSEDENIIYADISGDKNRLIWAKWRLAVAEAIGAKYNITLCGVSQNGGGVFTLRQLFCGR